MEDKLMLIGDVHGKVDNYWKLVNHFNGKSIQVGDFGFKNQHEWHVDNIDSKKHKICFGNHDDTTFLHYPHSLGNWSYCEERELMTVRGAFSIDKIHRTEGVDWWDNEELNYAEFQEVVDAYIKYKPKIMVTHDCPKTVRQSLFGITDKSITSNGLQGMFDLHKPEMWVFGHFHQSKDVVIHGTRFVCLDELEIMIID